MIPLRSFLAASFAALALSSCGEGTTQPARPVTYAVVLADGQALPSIVACPAPDDRTEAWVAFGDGLLTLHPNGTFEWQFNVGSGYRTWTPGADGSRQNLASYASGGTREIAGRVERQGDGSLLLRFEHANSSETPLAGGGRVTADGAEITYDVACPLAAEGVAPHTFRVTLR